MKAVVPHGSSHKIGRGSVAEPNEGKGRQVPRDNRPGKEAGTRRALEGVEILRSESG